MLGWAKKIGRTKRVMEKRMNASDAARFVRQIHSWISSEDWLGDGSPDYARYQSIFDALDTQIREHESTCSNYIINGTEADVKKDRNRKKAIEEEYFQTSRQVFARIYAICDGLIDRLTEDALPGAFYYQGMSLVEAKEQAAERIGELEKERRTGDPLTASNYRDAMRVNGLFEKTEESPSSQSKNIDSIINDFLKKYEGGAYPDKYKRMLDRAAFEKHIADEPEEIRPYLRKRLLLCFAELLKGVAGYVTEQTDDIWRETAPAAKGAKR